MTQLIELRIKWKMEHSTLFTSAHNDYNLLVTIESLGWVWRIWKGHEIIDCAYYHPKGPTSELDAKVKCERALNKIVNDKR